VFALLPFPAPALHGRGLRGSHMGAGSCCLRAPISPLRFVKRDGQQLPPDTQTSTSPIPTPPPAMPLPGRWVPIPEAEPHHPHRRDPWEMALIRMAEAGPPSPDFHSRRCNLSLPQPQILSSKGQELFPVAPRPHPSSVKAPGLGQARPSDAPRRINFCSVAAGLDASGCQEGAESHVV